MANGDWQTQQQPQNESAAPSRRTPRERQIPCDSGSRFVHLSGSRTAVTPTAGEGPKPRRSRFIGWRLSDVSRALRKTPRHSAMAATIPPCAAGGPAAMVRRMFAVKEADADAGKPAGCSPRKASYPPSWNCAAAPAVPPRTLESRPGERVHLCGCADPWQARVGWGTIDA
jgi:hypothetical protein